jgi:hypothetical protein
VPIYYESRLAKLALDEAERRKIDPDFEEATEGEEVERKEKLKTKWAQLEAVLGAEKRLELVAKDIALRFEKRLEALDGKAMIVCMSRRICVELYRELVRLRPDWAHDDDERGAVKVVMTGSASDPFDWQRHIRDKPRREAPANRFRDAIDPRACAVRDAAAPARPGRRPLLHRLRLRSLGFLEHQALGEALALGFLREHNPIVRHTVLRRRRTLEDAGLLERVGVEVHPDPQAPAGTYPGVAFEGLGLVTNHPFDLAYRAAEGFTEAWDGGCPRSSRPAQVRPHQRMAGL